MELLIYLFNLVGESPVYFLKMYFNFMGAGIAQSVWRLATSGTNEGSEFESW
jgi:hypothetical protein